MVKVRKVKGLQVGSMVEFSGRGYVFKDHQTCVWVSGAPSVGIIMERDENSDVTWLVDFGLWERPWGINQSDLVDVTDKYTPVVAPACWVASVGQVVLRLSQNPR